MKRRLLLLDLALVLFAAGLVWLLRERYVQARARELAVLRNKVPPKPVLAPQTPPPARPSQPAEYADVAQRTLFSKDRNPNVVVEPPKPAPERPMPALPIYHGQMDFGEPVAFLSLPNQAAIQKGYRPGDKVGEFKLVAFDREKIEFEWNGKKVERKPAELVAKEPAASAAPLAAATAALPSGAPAANGRTQSANIAVRIAAEEAAANGGTPAASAVNTLSSTANPSNAANSPPAGLGDEIGSGTRACLPGDTSPAGSVVGGYQKRMISSMFGSVCRWEQVK
jgi:hypothetical protein